MAACLAHGWVVSESAFFCRSPLVALQVGCWLPSARMGGRFPVSESIQRPTSSGRKFQSHRSALRAQRRLSELASYGVSRM